MYSCFLGNRFLTAISRWPLFVARSLQIARHLVKITALNTALSRRYDEILWNNYSNPQNNVIHCEDSVGTPQRFPEYGNGYSDINYMIIIRFYIRRGHRRIPP
ncbi:hypothetical protein J6590_024720 [Homalodisca vitripennis]|nr:hypothetical protein J6590_024720 [Homalodisca vitripennis]